MIKRILYKMGMASLAVLLLLALIPVQEASAGGTCTQEDIDDGWICISDRTGLEQISADLAGKYKLAGDIDLSMGGNWSPLGAYSNAPFTGEFDGNGYVISGMTITGSASFNGLFAYTEGASIRNVRLIDVDMDVSGDADDVGGLAGHATGGTRIENSLVTGSVKAFSSGGQTSRYVGGLIGDATGARIYHSSFYGTVEGNEDVGGMFGYSLQMEAYYSNSTGKVIGDINVGGFIGKLEGTNRIEDSYAAAEVELHGGSPGPARGFHAVSGFTTFSSKLLGFRVVSYKQRRCNGEIDVRNEKNGHLRRLGFPRSMGPSPRCFVSGSAVYAKRHLAELADGYGCDRRPRCGDRDRL